MTELVQKRCIKCKGEKLIWVRAPGIPKQIPCGTCSGRGFTIARPWGSVKRTAA